MTSTTPTLPGPAPAAFARVRAGFLWATLAAALVVRLLPFAAPGTRLLRQYPTEDGYLMLTIARNLALGHGMSTADGTIPTNGTQPLATFLYSAGYRILGGDKEGGVAVALALQVAAGLLTAFVLARLARRWFADDRTLALAAPIAAVLWFASPLVTVHGLNCLETGFYGLAVVLFAGAFVRRHPAGGGPGGMRRALELGLLAGVVLWARIDAVFLLATACLAWAFLDGGARLAWSRARLVEASVLGLAATCAIAPWLVHNRIGFGSFMPISGRAESFAAGFGANLVHLPAVLAEYVLLVIQVPERLEVHPAVVAGSLAVVGLAAFTLLRFAHAAPAHLRLVIVLAGVYVFGLSAYYGLLFGAPYFLSRYLFPLSALSALAWGVWLARLFARRPAPVLQLAAGALVIGAAGALHLRVWKRGLDHQHLQVVEWVQEHVPEATWVGAVQTGTVGYFHDRTINLDGKVNPEALAAVLARRIPEYVLEKPIEYLADWEGLAEWADLPQFRGRFEVVVHDRERNLAVLRRKD